MNIIFLLRIAFFCVVAFIVVVLYEQYKYKKACKEWLKKGDNDDY